MRPQLGKFGIALNKTDFSEDVIQLLAEYIRGAYNVSVFDDVELFLLDELLPVVCVEKEGTIEDVVIQQVAVSIQDYAGWFYTGYAKKAQMIIVYKDVNFEKVVEEEDL